MGCAGGAPRRPARPLPRCPEPRGRVPGLLASVPERPATALASAGAALARMTWPIRPKTATLPRAVMAWTIHSWASERGTGTIASPHFGPISFDAQANVDEVADFVVGEPVFVELDGNAPNFRVLLIRPLSQRQPQGTRWPLFDAVNGRFGDARIDEQSPETVQFWFGDCCESCTPNPVHVRFEGVIRVLGLGEDTDFSNPLFRLASVGEIRAHSLDVPADSRAFCIVTSHGEGLDGPPVFIVARVVRVVPPGRANPS